MAIIRSRIHCNAIYQSQAETRRLGQRAKQSLLRAHGAFNCLGKRLGRRSVGAVESIPGPKAFAITSSEIRWFNPLQVATLFLRKYLGLEVCEFGFPIKNRPVSLKYQGTHPALRGDLPALNPIRFRQLRAPTVHFRRPKTSLAGEFQGSEEVRGDEKASEKRHLRRRVLPFSERGWSSNRPRHRRFSMLGTREADLRNVVAAPWGRRNRERQTVTRRRDSASESAPFHWRSRGQSLRLSG